ncbi:hypothetical protein FLK61_40435 [Paenalkalicoccus suaedae]|uniref:YcxB family protein n=1 Tax=Paenalkalicoccus suaedae TaxID=2592382 RepID=A0A859FJ52_9BACI|nr:hypothetical protein [Paenalkalicoccus suaedae]QKS72872.1 hypothetical protein FLK61_40435 [Paenalkalicoccus suaedae]
MITTNPFFGRYFRYVLAILSLGVLIPSYLWPVNAALGVASIVTALAVTVGLDALIYFYVRSKAESLTSEKIEAMIPVMKVQGETSGYLVTTENYITFVSVFKRCTFQFKWEELHNYELSGQQLELSIVQTHQKRHDTFYVASPEKTRELLVERQVASVVSMP